MEQAIVHSVVFTFAPSPYSEEKKRVYVFGNDINKEVQQVLLDAEPQLPSVIIDEIMKMSHPSTDSFVRRSWTNKALGITRGRQMRAQYRVESQDVNAFVDFEKIFASTGIAGYGMITCMKINATQVKRANRNFSRTITVKFQTTTELDWDGNQSFERRGLFEICDWTLLPSFVGVGTRFGM